MRSVTLRGQGPEPKNELVAVRAHQIHAAGDLLIAPFRQSREDLDLGQVHVRQIVLVSGHGVSGRLPARWILQFLRTRKREHPLRGAVRIIDARGARQPGAPGDDLVVLGHMGPEPCDDLGPRRRDLRAQLRQLHVPHVQRPTIDVCPAPPPRPQGLEQRRALARHLVIFGLGARQTRLHLHHEIV